MKNRDNRITRQESIKNKKTKKYVLDFIPEQMALEKITKKGLAIKLSKLKSFDKPKPMLEQYATDSETASFVLWYAYSMGDIKDKIIADIGAGTGILGIGALLLEAKKVYFIEIDKDAIDILKQNLKILTQEWKIDIDIARKIKIINTDVENNTINIKADTVLQNPPFGIKKPYVDRLFLQNAFKIADVIYSFHNKKTVEFIKRYSEKKGFEITHIFTRKMQLKNTMPYHTSRIKRIDVAVLRIVRKQKIVKTNKKSNTTNK